VDRKQVMSHDEAQVREMMQRGIGALMHNREWLIMEWLWNVGKTAPKLGDLILLSLLDAPGDTSVRIGSLREPRATVNLASSGLFPSDREVFLARETLSSYTTVQMPFHKVRQISNPKGRFTSRRTAVFGSHFSYLKLDFLVVEADVVLRPSDGVLLSRRLDGKPPFIEAVTPPHVLGVAHTLNRAHREVMTRLREVGPALGVEVPEIDADALDDLNLSYDDWRLLSRDLYGRPPFVTDVTRDRLVIVAWVTDTPVPDLLARLRPLAEAGVLTLPDDLPDFGAA
jgi:hypothetical protein